MVQLANCGVESGETASVCAGVDCGEHGQCAEGAEGPVCVCAPGYAPGAAGACEAVLSACAGKECGAYGSCLVDGAGAAVCVCEPGFVSGAGGCVPAEDGGDPCEGIDCGAHGSCVASPSGAHCVCDAGYALVGATCVAEAPPADPCEDQVCGQGAFCVESSGAAVCVCEAGTVGDGAGCVTPSTPDSPCDGITCDGHGACLVAASGAPVCLCDAGYDSTGAGCAAVPQSADPCKGVACDGHGVCLASASGVAVCLCDPGYISAGAACEPAPTEGSPCKGIDCGGQGVCTAGSGGNALCVCKPGFESTGLGCAPLVDPCAGIGCAGLGTCVAGAGGKPVCVCEAGAYTKGASCLPNLDPCAEDPCGGHGACVVTAQGPVCLCEPAFVADGAACEPATGDPCAGVVCSGQGTCMIAAGAPVCACNPGWTAAGTTCVPTDAPCAGVTCGGMGACLVAASGLPVCLCEAGAYSVGLSCFPAPAGAIPETAASDVSLAVVHPQAGTDYVPNDLLVYAVEGHDAEALQTAVAAEGATVVAYQPQVRRYLVRLPGSPTAQALDDLASALAATGQVATTSPLWVDAPAADPLYYPTTDSGWGYVSWDPGDVSGTNWYLKQVRAPNAWGYTTGSSTVPVGVIDRGSITNPDLVVSWTLPWAVTTPGKVFGESSTHGNQVAGVLAARGDNGAGLTGVLWNAPLFYCETDGTPTRAFDCMRYMVKAGVKVINYSASLGYRDAPCWGDPWTCDFAQQYPPTWDVAASKPSWKQELDAMSSDDWILVQAAGNEAIQAKYAAWPAMALLDAAGKGRALVVGAVTSMGARRTCGRRIATTTPRRTRTTTWASAAAAHGMARRVASTDAAPAHEVRDQRHAPRAGERRTKRRATRLLRLSVRRGRRGSLLAALVIVSATRVLEADGGGDIAC